MIDERMFNLLRDQLSTSQTEKGALYTQITSLTAEIRMLRDENKRYRTEDKSSNQQLQTTLSSVKAQLEAALSLLEKKDEVISILNQELAKERDRNANNNRKNYGRTSEQARLLNNRNVDERSQEKADYDGDSVEKANDDTSTETPSKETKKEKRLRGKKNKSEGKFVNETVMHKLADYHTLPEGGHYLTRKGEIETYLYEYTEYHPARVVRHIYEVARVGMPDGETIISSLPEELRKAAAKGCPFDAKMMSFILCEKYAYHSPINTVKKKLRDMGAVFSKTTLNRYYHMGVEALRDCFDSTLRGEIHKSNYLMIDETCELVGVTSRPILAKIYIMVRRMYRSPQVMANPTMAKAVNYTLNQWDNLRNFILDGEAEISNNLVEQRMKPIKLDLKNSQNIGSEDAAKRHAFMHSLIESCSMNKITPYGYLVNLLERYKTLTEEEKPALMPCYYKNNLKN